MVMTNASLDQTVPTVITITVIILVKLSKMRRNMSCRIHPSRLRPTDDRATRIVSSIYEQPLIKPLLKAE